MNLLLRSVVASKLPKATARVQGWMYGWRMVTPLPMRLRLSFARRNSQESAIIRSPWWKRGSKLPSDEQGHLLNCHCDAFHYNSTQDHMSFHLCNTVYQSTALLSVFCGRSGERETFFHFSLPLWPLCRSHLHFALILSLHLRRKERHRKESHCNSISFKLSLNHPHTQ